MGNIYLIADLHFGSQNIINMCRPKFKNTDEMDNFIIKRWNSTVKDEDIVYVLGDVGNLNRVKELKGHKILIRGNHDQFSHETAIKNGFVTMIDCPIVLDNFFILSHEPQFVSKNAPYANIFGHVHDNPMYKTVSRRSFCVSVERIEYTPILFSQIKTAMRKASKQDDSHQSSIQEDEDIEKSEKEIDKMMSKILEKGVETGCKLTIDNSNPDCKFYISDGSVSITKPKYTDEQITEIIQSYEDLLELGVDTKELRDELTKLMRSYLYKHLITASNSKVEFETAFYDDGTCVLRLILLPCEEKGELKCN